MKRSVLAWSAIALMYVGGLALAVLVRTNAAPLAAWSVERGMVAGEVQRLLLLVATVISCVASLTVSFLLWTLGELRRALAQPRRVSQIPQTIGFLAGLVLFMLALIVIGVE